MARIHRQERTAQNQEPQSAEEYRKECDTLADSFLYAILRQCSNGAMNVPFKFNDDLIEEIHCTASELIELIRSGKIIKLRGPHNPARIAEVKAAEGDAAFQKFLDRITTPRAE